MSAAFHLARLLESEPGIEVHGTAHIACDAKTAGYLARRMSVPAEYAYLVFGGRPVKVAIGITRWALAEPDPRERLRMLSHWSRRHGGPADDCAYWGAVRQLRQLRSPREPVTGGAA